jgi:hypothetical protein
MFHDVQVNFLIPKINKDKIRKCKLAQLPHFLAIMQTFSALNLPG